MMEGAQNINYEVASLSPRNVAEHMRLEHLVTIELEGRRYQIVEESEIRKNSRNKDMLDRVKQILGEENGIAVLTETEADCLGAYMAIGDIGAHPTFHNIAQLLEISSSAVAGRMGELVRKGIILGKKNTIRENGKEVVTARWGPERIAAHASENLRRSYVLDGERYDFVFEEELGKVTRVRTRLVRTREMLAEKGIATLTALDVETLDAYKKCIAEKGKTSSVDLGEKLGITLDNAYIRMAKLVEKGFEFRNYTSSKSGKA